MKIMLNYFTLLLIVTIAFFTLKIDSNNKTVFNNKQVIHKKKQDANGAIEWLNRRRVNLQTGKIDINDIIKAQDAVAVFQNNKSLNSLGLSFTEMGPNNVGGRTRALLIDNVDNNLMFAGGVGGGLWKSTNGGGSWSKVTNGDFWDSINIASICQDSNGDIYVGTGEGMYYNSGTGTGGLAGSGIWKSTDHGQSFYHLTSTWSDDSINEIPVKQIFVNVNEIATDLTTSNLIYASTSKGLMASDDAGSSWYNPVINNYYYNNPSYNQDISSDVKVASDGSVIASIGNKAYYANSKPFNLNIQSITKSDSNLVLVVGKNGKVLKSVNSGNSWTSVTSGIYTHIYSYSKSDVSTGFAVGNSGKIYKTNNGGNSWQTLTSGTTSQLESVYFVSSISGYAVGYNGTILKTTNSGQTWTTITSGTTENFHCVDFIPSAIGFAVGDLGKIKKTANGGTSWSSSSSGTSYNLNSVNCISISKVIAVGDSGIIKKTINGGTSWTTIYTASTQNFKSVLFINLSEGFIVGTNGTILYSNDEGLNWSTIYSGTSANLNNIFFKGSVGYIVGDAGTILKSDDGGMSWGSLTSGVSVNLHAIYFNDFIKVKTQSPHNLNNGDIISLKTEINSYNYSGTIFSIVSSDEFYIDIPYSVDTFNVNGCISNLINLYTKASLSPSVGRLEFAFSPSNPDYIYCSAIQTNGILENVYQSKNKGITWSIIAAGDNGLFNPFSYQGTYDNSIAVYPNNSESTLLGGIDIWKRLQGGIYEQISLGNNESSSSYVHSDIHSFVFHPSYSTNNTFYVGCDGGVFKSVNNGNSFTEINDSYNVTQFYSVAASPIGAVVGGTQDNGTQYITSTGTSPATGTEILGSDGGYAFCSALNPNVIFSSTYFGNVYRSQNNGTSMSAYYTGGSGGNFVTPFRIWESFHDSLSTDSVVYTYPSSSPIVYPGQTINVVATSKINNRQIYCNYTVKNNDTLYPGETIKVQDYYQAMFALGMTNSIYISRKPLDFTSTSILNTATNISGLVETLEFSKDGNYLYIATPNRIYRIDSLLYKRTTAQLQNLSADLIGIFGSQTITSMAVDPQNPENLIVTLGNYGENNHVYYSSNAATCPNSTSLSNFTLAQGNLPSMPVYSSLIFWNDSKTVIIGTEYGVFSTADITESYVQWSKETSFPNVATFMLTQQLFENNGNNGVTNHGYIYAATHGRGLWRSESNAGPLAEKTLTQQSETTDLKIYPNPASDIAHIEYISKKAGSILINLYNSNGTNVKKYKYEISNGFNKISFDVSELQKGIYYISLNSDNKQLTSKLIVY
ncbi:MAG: hypothetical protein A2046_16060 [Bacteroidetes bacterium GWA2_30_7]|nr:MAG: hypothetical protein A2046_16060 [Bacteroidetes bacterium GWA2_30_7]